jgi:hypothetical protein
MGHSSFGEDSLAANQRAFVELREYLAEKTTDAKGVVLVPSVSVARIDNVQSAADQILLVARYLKLKVWSGLMACCLINGVLPVEGSLDAMDELTTFDGRKISIGSTLAHRVRRDLSEWRTSERNVGLIDPISFFAWCEEEDIDTNYVRLFREVAGCGSGKMIGILPLKEVVRYSFD